MAERGFKGIWIPAEVWLDERLSAIEKSVLAEIDSLSRTDTGCVAGNEYFAAFCQCSKRTVTDAVSHLTKLGLVETVSFDGRSRQLRSCVAVSARQSSKNCEADAQNLPGSIAESARQSSKNCAHINIPINPSIKPSIKQVINKSNTARKRGTFKAPSVEEVSGYAAEMGWSESEFSPDGFVNFYESKGWKVGKTPMKDWKAAARGWVARFRKQKGETDSGKRNAQPKRLGKTDIIV